MSDTALCFSILYHLCDYCFSRTIIELTIYVGFVLILVFFILKYLHYPFPNLYDFMTLVASYNIRAVSGKGIHKLRSRKICQLLSFSWQMTN